MNNNGFRNGTLFGSILGASLGMFLSKRMSPWQKRKIMRTARRAKSTFMDGIDNLWR